MSTPSSDCLAGPRRVVLITVAMALLATIVALARGPAGGAFGAAVGVLGPWLIAGCLALYGVLRWGLAPRLQRAPSAAETTHQLWLAGRNAALVLVSAAAVLETWERGAGDGVKQETWMLSGPPLGGPHAFRFDDELGWVGQPHRTTHLRTGDAVISSTTNAHGFFDIDQDIDLDGPPRLVVVGDSFGRGWGVPMEEALTARIRAALPQYQIVCQAVAGYRLDQIGLAYTRFARPLAPHAVVLAVIASTSERESRPVQGHARPWCVLRDGELYWYRGPIPALPDAPEARIRYAARQEHAAVVSAGDAWHALLAWVTRHTALGSRTQRALQFRFDSIDRRAALDPVTTALVAHLDAQVRADGGRLLVAVAPPSWATRAKWATNNITRWCDDLRAAAGAEVLDLTPALVLEEGALYTEGANAHPNAAGHAAAAAAIVRALETRQD